MTLNDQAAAPDAITFMVVDDDSIVVHSLARALRALGKVAFSSEFDRVHIAAASALPRIMLIDIDLPSVTGIEIARRIRSNPELDSVYILMMTAHRSEAVLKQVEGLKADGLIEKPVDIPALLVRVQGMLQQVRS